LISDWDLIQEIAKIALSGESAILEVEVGVYVGLTPLAPKRPLLPIVDVWDLSLGLAILIFILRCLSKWLYQEAKRYA